MLVVLAAALEQMDSALCPVQQMAPIEGDPHLNGPKRSNTCKSWADLGDGLWTLLLLLPLLSAAVPRWAREMRKWQRHRQRGAGWTKRQLCRLTNEPDRREPENVRTKNWWFARTERTQGANNNNNTTAALLAATGCFFHFF